MYLQSSCDLSDGRVSVRFRVCRGVGFLRFDIIRNHLDGRQIQVQRFETFSEDTEGLVNIFSHRALQVKLMPNLIHGDPGWQNDQLPLPR